MATIKYLIQSKNENANIYIRYSINRESVRINPTISTIFKIARTLEVPLQELFNFELQPFSNK